MKTDNPAPQEGDRLVLHTRVVTGSGGGPDKTILNSPRFLEAKGYPMVCAYLRDPRDTLFGELERRARQWGATLLPVDDFGALDWRVVTRLKTICQRLKPMIWHGHDYKTNLLGLIVNRSFPMKLITTVHGWVKHTWKTPLYYAIDRACLRRYDEVVCVSQDLYQSCRRLGVREEQCWHVPNAIDTDAFCRSQTSSEAKREYSVPRERLVIGAVGRLSAEKGFDLLIRSVAQLIAKGFDVEVWIAGEGDQEYRLQRLAEDLNLSDRVRLLGFQPDPIRLYQAMDVFALSSLREGLPNVLLEAMALEVPVVCTRVAGIPKLIDHEENGLLLDPGSIESLSDGLGKILTSSEMRARLASSARRTVENNHGFAPRMDRIKSIYDGMFVQGSSR